MPTLRTVYRTGTAIVVNLPKIHREMCDLKQGCTARVDCFTPRMWLREMGVANTIIDQLVCGEDHFVVIRRHYD